MSMRLGAILLLAVAGTAIGGIQGTGYRMFASFGTVDSGGGVSVNGVPYDTSHAHVTVNGRPGDISELRKGHIVAAHGSKAKGKSAAVAEEIVLDSDVRGEVTSVDRANGVFTVLGQAIQLTGDSVLDPQLELRKGAWVKVSAFERSDETFVASRVDLDLAPGESQVRGVAQSLDRQSRTLRIGELMVDYSGARTSGEIADGAVVLVRGLQPLSNGSLYATSVSVFGGVGRAGERGDIKGIITAYASPGDFEINGQPVLAGEKVVYVLHGQALGPDVQVRVTGRFDSSGVLIARKVQADSPGQAKKNAKKAK